MASISSRESAGRVTLRPVGIADHPGEVADHEDDVVAEILQLPQLVELDRVPEVEVGTGRIEALLDLQGFSAGELGRELGLDQQLVGAAAKDRELVRRGSIFIVVSGPWRPLL